MKGNGDALTNGRDTASDEKPKEEPQEDDEEVIEDTAKFSSDSEETEEHRTVIQQPATSSDEVDSTSPIGSAALESGRDSTMDEPAKEEPTMEAKGNVRAETMQEVSASQLTACTSYRGSKELVADCWKST